VRDETDRGLRKKRSAVEDCEGALSVSRDAESKLGESVLRLEEALKQVRDCLHK
jgi:hypothetical protein